MPRGETFSIFAWRGKTIWWGKALLGGLAGGGHYELLSAKSMVGKKKSV